jgi:predicted ATPase
MELQAVQSLLAKRLNLKNVGVNIKMSGFILADKDTKYLISFPNEDDYDAKDLIAVATDSKEYKEIIRQLDLMELEIIDNDTNKKVIVRKSQRQLDQGVSWEVFARDNYTCRYCGSTGIPMTYDHIKLWEDGGENTVENGVCSCRKCNKTRGNMDYEEWINSKYYITRSENLSRDVIMANNKLLKEYKSFPNRVSKRKR